MKDDYEDGYRDGKREIADELLIENNSLREQLSNMTAVVASVEKERDDAQLLVQLSLETAEHRMALQLQVAELMKDAERYQMLRRGQHWSVINGIGDILRGDGLDAAIDEELK